MTRPPLLLPTLDLPRPRQRIVDGRYRRDPRAIACEESHERLRRVEDVEGFFRPAIEEICRRHGVPTDRLRKFARGFNLVYGAGEDLVVKLYCGYFPEDCDIECASLQALEDTAVAPPRIVARGELEGWPYLVMTRLQGVELSTIWDEIDEADRIRLLRDVGAAVADMQAVGITDELRPWIVDWTDFAAHQAIGAADRQSEQLAASWVAQIEPFIADHLPLVPTQTTPVLLHTELVDAVWLVQQRTGRWELTGIYDFADAMVGDAGYDLAAPPVFLGRGKADRHRAFLEGAGLSPKVADEAWRRRSLLYLLLHPYSNLAWYMKVAPPPPRVTTLEQLADFWFAA